MCGRYSQTAEETSLAQRFGIALAAGVSPRYNIAPGQKIPVIIQSNEGPSFVFMRWGLVPSWVKTDFSDGIINARAETLADKPSFSESLRKRRCIVPADSFYEWPKKSAGAERTPVRILMKSRTVFAMAGLWNVRKDSEGRDEFTFAIITTAANDLLASLHHRMPAILSEKAESSWLDAAFPNPLSLLRPYPAEEMEIYRVSPIVNSPRNDIPECAMPLTA